eukprot:TRINITY_DN3921_c0_g1_i1.p1 TRINITY_DN3921_c0_g1~~TRINITY_DN3921_c0_g1_i1.p1  ORF type:complete len:770 (+),score=169.72 TRINITY_DN3921_c0_g1_i1:47-2311(+)
MGTPRCFRFVWLFVIYLVFFTTAFQRPKQVVEDIEYVHVISMNHLDIGFDGIMPTVGFAINVINKYFDVFFPNATITTAALRARGGPERLIYTTHPWLVAVYTDPNCSQIGVPELSQIGETLHCPNASMLTAFEKAIALGDIAWHAFPFNGQAESMDPSLFESALEVARSLDLKYHGKNKTMTMSQRDVPGMTRSVIPLLRKKGVEAITVGVNAATAPPSLIDSVGPGLNPFVWKDPQSGESVIAMWHPNGYGGINVTDCVLFPGFKHALAPAFRTDNHGPPGEDEVVQNFAILQAQFPNAQILASTWDQFVELLLPIKSKFQVVSEEVGDTWVYGIPSDPLKAAQFRAISRVRSACLQTPVCQEIKNTSQWRNFDLLLMKVAEHTWGLDVKTFLNDWGNWSNAAFEKVRTLPNYELMINSWIEQRQFIVNAVAALGDSPLVEDIERELDELVPNVPDTSSYTPVKDLTKRFKIGDFEIGFNGTNGGINHLFSSHNNWTYSTEQNQLGQYSYQTLDSEDVWTFLKDYMNCDPLTVCTWAEMDFGKPNVTLGDPISKIWYPTLSSAWERYHKEQYEILIELSMPSDSYQLFGAPITLWSKFAFKGGEDGDLEIKIELEWFNKTATRLPESHWFGFNPIVPFDWNLYLKKLGEWVDPLQIALNGSQHLHGVESLTFAPMFDSEAGHSFDIYNVDSPIVSVGTVNPFPTPMTPPLVTEGVNFNLFNNVWGTNFIMWYPYLDGDDASKFRFRVKINSM